MTSRLLFVVSLVCARPAAGADIVKAAARDTVMRAAAPDTAILAAAARDSAIRWQFDAHG